jgi:hypothetical protein
MTEATEPNPSPISAAPNLPPQNGIIGTIEHTAFSSQGWAWLVVGGVAGFTAHLALAWMDAQTKRNDIIIQKRIEIYDHIAPMLNDVYVYVQEVGQYKELTPPEIIKNKREIDKAVYSNIPYLSKNFFAHYNVFMNDAFCTYRGPGQDARILSNPSDYRTSAEIARQTNKSYPAWNDKWDNMFQSTVSKGHIADDYYNLLTSLAGELDNTLSINSAGAKEEIVRINSCN